MQSIHRVKARLISFLIALSSAIPAMAGQWASDTLGPDFQKIYFNQGTDYSGPVRSTLIRYVPSDTCRKAVVYIHGFNDYFFQKEMAEEFGKHGYAFYAIDLRKYGRSLMKHQKRCQVRNFKEYFPDIDSAFRAVLQAVPGRDSIILMGHSTGGLLASYYLANTPSAPVGALILNSPFLDWNLGKLECFVPFAATAGAIFPSRMISSGSSRAYGESLNQEFHGEWTFDTLWKSISPAKVELSWIRAVDRAQRWLRGHPYSINCPILLLYSSESCNLKSWNENARHADAVLDVADIKKYGLKLGHQVTAARVNGGIHDLILSRPDVRYPLYAYIFRWLRQHVPPS